MKRLIVFVFLIVLAAFYVGTSTVRAENQPHMRSALEHLQAAKSELEMATRDKGGHRDAALRATNEAIEHVRDGIGFANRHRR